jgi:hypothetical protein
MKPNYQTKCHGNTITKLFKHDTFKILNLNCANDKQKTDGCMVFISNIFFDSADLV